MHIHVTDGIFLVSWTGFEPTTVRLEGGSSIQLSYQDSTIFIAEIRALYKLSGWNFSRRFIGKTAAQREFPLR